MNKTDIELNILSILVQNPIRIIDTQKKIKAKYFTNKDFAAVYLVLNKLFELNITPSEAVIHKELSEKLEATVIEEIFRNQAIEADLFSHIGYLIYAYKTKYIIDELNNTKKCLTNTPTNNSKEAIESLNKSLLTLTSIYNSTTNLTVENSSVQVKEFFNELIDIKNNGDADKKVLTYYSELDNIIGGFKLGELIILGARPAVGKTALALNFIFNKFNYNINKDDIKPVLFISLEMSVKDILSRSVSIITDIPVSDIINVKLSIEELEALCQNISDTCESSLVLTDNSNLDIDSLCTFTGVVKSIKDISMVIIDYLQLIEVKNELGTLRTKFQDVSVVSRRLKLLARKLNIPVLALAQLSRASEKRENKTPVLSDLRDSGTLEQDADIVILLSPVEESTVLVDVVKNRGGRRGSTILYFESDTVSFK